MPQEKVLSDALDDQLGWVGGDRRRTAARATLPSRLRASDEPVEGRRMNDHGRTANMGDESHPLIKQAELSRDVCQGNVADLIPRHGSR